MWAELRDTVTAIEAVLAQQGLLRFVSTPSYRNGCAARKLDQSTARKVDHSRAFILRRLTPDPYG